MPRSNKPLPDVYDYESSRQFLKDWLEAKGWSYKQFAEYAGLSNASRVANLIAGRDNLGEAALVSFLLAFGLDSERTRYLRLLINQEQCRRDLVKAQEELARAQERERRDPGRKTRRATLAREETVKFFEKEEKKALSEALACKALARARTIDPDTAEVLAHWYYNAIAEYTRCQDYSYDPAKIVTAFAGAVSADEVHESLSVLRKLGVLSTEFNRANDAPHTTEANVSNIPLDDFYRGLHEQSGAALAAYLARSNPKRKELTRFGALTFALPDAAVPEMKKLVIAFQRDLHQAAEAHRDKPLDRVFELFIHLFPVTWRDGDR